MLSGFAGAFFAFLFICITAVFSRIYQREVRNQICLFRLYHFVNLAIQALSDNLLSIESFTKTVKKLSINNNIYFWQGHLGDIPVDTSIAQDLWNADLLNETISLMFGLQKAKSSLDTLFTIYKDNRASFQNGQIGKENFISNCRELCSNMKKVENFLKLNRNECFDVAATARVLMKRKPIVSYIHKFLSDQNLSSRQRIMIIKERDQIKKEIEEIRLKSELKIKEINNGDSR